MPSAEPVRTKADRPSLSHRTDRQKRQGDIENRRPIKKTDEERNSSMAKTGKLKRVTSLMLALVLAVSPVTAYATDSTAEVASETEPSAGYETEYETDYEQETAAEGYVSEEEEYEEDPAPEEDTEAGEAQDIPEESDEEDVFESGSEDVDDIEDPYIEEEGEEAQEDEHLEEDQTEQEAGQETEQELPTFNEAYEFSGSLEGKDFSSCRLLIATDDESVFTWDTVILSEYNGIYLVSFEDEEKTENAYTYYYDNVEFVEPDMQVTVASDMSDYDGEEEAGTEEEETEDTYDEESYEDSDTEEPVINNNDDAISALNKLTEEITEETAEGDEVTPVIALIDTGIASDRTVYEAVSVIGEEYEDDNGHGTDMYDLITSEDPDAQIMSIKALDGDGVCSVSDIYAAIEYAIARNVSIINLSVNAYLTEGSETISKAIDEAVSYGIIVVGAAGNNGRDAKWFVPGSVESAHIIGACDEHGERLSMSNYGETVDYYVNAESTSEAAAVFTGLVSKYGIDGIEELLNKGKVFTEDGKIDEAPEEKPEDVQPNDDTVSIASYNTGEGSYPVPTADNNTYTGTEAAPNTATFGNGIEYRYKHTDESSNNVDYYEDVLGHTTVMDVTDSKGNSSKAVCVDPYATGASSWGNKTSSHVERITSANIIKALYFGTEDATYINSLISAGEYSESRSKWVLIHYALAYYTWANGLITNSDFVTGTHGSANRPGYDAFWRWSSQRLRNDVAAYMDYIESQSIPTNVALSAYIVYPEGDKQPHGKQSYIYLVVKNKAKFHVKKVSSNPSMTSSSYRLSRAEYWVYTGTNGHSQAEARRTGSSRIAVLTTDQNGITDSFDAVPGQTYYIIEGVAPRGYKRNDTIKTIVAAAGKDLEWEHSDTPYTINLSIYKRQTGYENYADAEMPLSGARFVLYSSYAAALEDDASQRVRVNGYSVFTTNEQGKATVSPLPWGTYYIKEVTAPAGYEIYTRLTRVDEPETGDTTPIPVAARIYEDLKGSLRVEKHVTGTAGDTNKDFRFVVTLKDSNDAAVTGTYTYTGSKSGSLTFGASGTAKFTLKDNEYIEIKYLPKETKYTVTEDNYTSEGYVTTKSGDTGTIAVNTTKTASFTNNKEPDTGGLKVTKTVNGTGADLSKNFTFTVNLKNGNTPVSGTFGGTTFNASGNTTFTLHDGQSKTITNIPTGYTYTVTETTDSNYTVTPSTGTITGTVTESTAL